MTDRCVRCDGDVRRAFAGRTEVLRHVVAPKDPHYPVLTPRSDADPLSPLRPPRQPDSMFASIPSREAGSAAAE